ncbi:MAG: protein kinase [Gemmatimonadales bacterium]
MTAPPAPLRDALADRYLLEREIGRGATAAVYLARDAKHGRPVAVKVLHREFAESLAGERFTREIGIAARLQHPHILPLLDSGAAAGTFYFVMPFAEGRTLREELRAHGAFSISDTIRILADVVDALVYAHAQGVVHRDIKPDNIMLSGRHALVMDFGVAKALDAAGEGGQLTRDVAIGTPAYMAPEQAVADPAVDHRADLYAVGVVGYELLSGKPPFRGTPQEVLSAHVVREPEPIASQVPHLPPALAALVMRCLAKAPGDRFQAAGEILAVLDPLATPSGGTTPVGSPVVTRSRRGVWLVGALALAAATWFVSRLPTREPARLMTVASQLTTSGAVQEGVISPDGQFLAYVTADSLGDHLQVQDVSGARRIPIADGARIIAVTWSADGTELNYCISGPEETTTMVAPRLGGSSRVVGRGTGYRAPDGRHTAMVSVGDPAIAVLDRTGLDTIHLARPPGFDFLTGVNWSKDGERLVLAVSSPTRGVNAIVTLTLAGEATTLVTDSVTLISPLLADARTLYYLRFTEDQVTDLMRQDLGRDGRPRGLPVPVATRLEVHTNDARSPSHVPLSMDPAGRIVITRSLDLANVATVAIGAKAPEPRFLTMGTAEFWGPRFAPDGRRIALFRRLGTGAAVGTAAIDSGDFVPIRGLDAGEQLAWSPDGSAVAVVGRTPGPGNRVTVRDLASGVTRTFPVPAAGRITWAATGIVAQSGNNRRLIRLDPATGSELPVPGMDSIGFRTNAKFSQNGRRLAFTWRPTPTTPGLYLIDLDANDPARLVLAGSYSAVAWDADGEGLFVRRSIAQEQVRELFHLRIGGELRSVLVLPEGYGIEDVSADGRTVLVTQVDARSDLIALARPEPR